MSLARIASLMALAACALSAQISPSKLDEAKRLSQGWKRWVGGRERPFQELSPKDQLDFLIGTARNNQFTPNRDAALALLSQWPYEQGLAPALRDNPDGARALQAMGYSRPESWSSPARPWVHGVGLHLEPKGWRLQVIPQPAFLASTPWAQGLPRELGPAPVPSVLIHLDHLRPGLARLSDLVGGSEDNLLRTAAASGRAGFLITHVQAWIAKNEPALGALGDRQAWILHYGHTSPDRHYRRRTDEPVRAEGTLAFVPGPLPARVELGMGLLKLNPFSSGARSRSFQLQDGRKGEMIKGSGGVLYLVSSSEGTWISDRISCLDAFGHGDLLDGAQGWGRVAMSGADHASVSLWVIPRHATGAGFESALGALKPAGAQAVDASLLKAAPRGGAAVAALGSGPTARALQAFFTIDRPFEVPAAEAPALAGNAVTLSPEQQKAFEAAKTQAEARRAHKEVLRRALDRLGKMLDGQGAALHWNGWTSAPPLSEGEKVALRNFRKQGWWMRGQERMNQAPGFGGFGEPGLTPSFALALPLKTGQAAETDLLLKSLFAKAFKGTMETRAIGAATLRRMKTAQAFAPSYAITGDLLVLASDDAAAASVLAGLQGQAPTLADLPARGWGQLELDGPRVAKEMEQLLLAYLGAQSGKPRYWWDEGGPVQSGDEVAEEVASTFGPFLDLMKKQGRLHFSVDLDGSGFELRPQ